MRLRLLSRLAAMAAAVVLLSLLAPPSFGQQGQGRGRGRGPRPPSGPTPHWPDGRVNLGPLPGQKGVWSGQAGTTFATNPNGIDNFGQNLPTNLKIADVPFQDWARSLYMYR